MLKKRGVALIWAITMITVILVIVGTISTIIIKDMRLSANAVMSEQAYAAARTGIDVAIDNSQLCLSAPSTLSGFYLDPPKNTVFYRAEYEIEDDGVTCTIRVTGGVGTVTNPNVVRRLKAKITDY